MYMLQRPAVPSEHNIPRVMYHTEGKCLCTSEEKGHVRPDRCMRMLDTYIAPKIDTGVEMRPHTFKAMDSS